MGFPGQGSQDQGKDRYPAQQCFGFNAITTGDANRASSISLDTPSFLSLVQSARGLSVDQSDIRVVVFSFSFSSAPCALDWKDSASMLSPVPQVGRICGSRSVRFSYRTLTFEVGLQFVVIRATRSRPILLILLVALLLQP